MLVRLRVRLKGEGEDGDREEVIFAPGDAPTRTVALVQPDDGDFSYSYEVEGYTPAGLPRPGASGSTADRVLVVPLPP